MRQLRTGGLGVGPASKARARWPPQLKFRLRRNSTQLLFILSLVFSA
jgi:hypothetical protein